MGGAALLEALSDDAVLRTRLMAVLGMSVALGEHLVRHHEDWRLLVGDIGDPAGDAAQDLLAAVGAAPGARRCWRCESRTAVGCWSWPPST